MNACLLDTELPKYLTLEGLALLPADSLPKFAGLQLPVYAVADGLFLAAGKGRTLPIKEMPGVFTLPGIYVIQWQRKPPHQ